LEQEQVEMMIPSVNVYSVLVKW